MKQIDTFKRDNLLVDFIYQHKGAKNVVSTKEIAKYIEERGYKQKVETINMIIRRLVFERKLPICSINSKGYYWANTKQEILDTIADLEGRIAEMKNRIELLNSFVLF